MQGGSARFSLHPELLHTRRTWWTWRSDLRDSASGTQDSGTGTQASGTDASGADAGLMGSRTVNVVSPGSLATVISPP